MRRESSTVVVMVGEVTWQLLAELRQVPNIAVLGPPDAAEEGLAAGIHALREASRRASPFVVVPADPLAAVAAEWQAMWDITQAPRGAAGFEARAAEALAAWHARQFELPDYYLVLAETQSAAAARQPEPAGRRAGPAGSPAGGAVPRPGPASSAGPQDGFPGLAPGPGGQPGQGGANRQAGPRRQRGPQRQLGPSLHLGPIRAVRPRRVAVAPVSATEADGAGHAAAPVTRAIRSLPHGPWWPPLDEVLAAARSFYPGDLAERQDPLSAGR